MFRVRIVDHFTYIMQDKLSLDNAFPSSDGKIPAIVVCGFEYPLAPFTNVQGRRSRGFQGVPGGSRGARTPLLFPEILLPAVGHICYLDQFSALANVQGSAPTLPYF